MQETRHQKAHLQDFAHRNIIDHRVLNLSESHLPFSSSSRPFPRRILHPGGYAGQHVHLLPESPSPICSHPLKISSSDSDTFYSDIASHFPSPRNQSFGTSCNEDNNCSSCYCEIEEWLEHANKFCRPFNFNARYHLSSDTGDSLDQNGRSPEVKLSISSICKKFLDHELYSNTQPSANESTVYGSQSCLACINSVYGTSKSERDQGQRKLLSRPKPYKAYLNEIEMQKLETERDSWKRARHLELLERMRRKEAAIDDWELQKTRIAVEKMKKLQQNLQNKLETKQLEVASKTQKKLCLLKQKAEKKQKRDLRRTTIEKISTTTNVSGTHTCSCRGFTCLKLGSFC
ncbi:uncharacterized protein LOC129287605 [Prosopis cineraria]|uniref:uncharacterized protein LOC129287605 n=1 Tax=Prosopis cineraria TaxID=364024 RepID=UPI00240FA0FF|nr:uncharacterized protein LOC129287605 [Prosopis cineraria]